MGSLLSSVCDGRLVITQNGVRTFSGFVEGCRARQACEVPSGDLVLVLIECVGDTWKPFENLLGVTSDGAVLWRAELPTYSGGDYYVAIDLADDGSVAATSWSCFQVTLDVSSGRIIRRLFTK